MPFPFSLLLSRVNAAVGRSGKIYHTNLCYWVPGPLQPLQKLLLFKFLFCLLKWSLGGQTTNLVVRWAMDIMSLWNANQGLADISQRGDCSSFVAHHWKHLCRCVRLSRGPPWHTELLPSFVQRLKTVFSGAHVLMAHIFYIWKVLWDWQYDLFSHMMRDASQVN